jgi:hypothetical protein
VPRSCIPPAAVQRKARYCPAAFQPSRPPRRRRRKHHKPRSYLPPSVPRSCIPPAAVQRKARSCPAALSPADHHGAVGGNTISPLPTAAQRAQPSQGLRPARGRHPRQNQCAQQRTPHHLCCSSHRSMPPLLRLSRFACWANCLVWRASPASPAATTLRQQMVAFPCGRVSLSASLLLLYPISGAFVKGLAGIFPGNHPYSTPFRGRLSRGWQRVFRGEGDSSPAFCIPPLPSPSPPLRRGERDGVRGDSSLGVPFLPDQCTLIRPAGGGQKRHFGFPSRRGGNLQEGGKTRLTLGSPEKLSGYQVVKGGGTYELWTQGWYNKTRRHRKRA